MTLAETIALFTTIGVVTLGVIQLIRPYIKDARLLKIMEIAEKLIGAAVAGRQQGVLDLKDPNKPGEWTPAAAAAAKAGAIDDAKKDMPSLEGKMQSLGIKNPDETLGKMVEQKVIEMQASNPRLVGSTLTTMDTDRGGPMG